MRKGGEERVSQTSWCRRSRAPLRLWNRLLYPNPQLVEREVPRRLKTLWIYVGPIADIGWTAAHHEGRGYVETRFIERVSEA